MDGKYPVIKIARERLKQMGKDMPWLEEQTGRTLRWYNNNPEIEKIEYQVLVKMSKALNFDFISDHRKFLGESLPEHQLNEPLRDYEKEEKKVTVFVILKSTVMNMQVKFPKLLKLIQEKGAEMGFEIE